MILNIHLFFKTFDVTLWVKESSNVAHTIFVVSHDHMKCNKPKIFALAQYLKNWYIRKVSFGNTKKSPVFYVKCFLISRLLVQSDKNTMCHANCCHDEKKFNISVI